MTLSSLILYRRLCLGFIAVFLAACQGYDVTVNDRVVYSPEPLFSDFDLPDPGLAACVKQAVIDTMAHRASDLAVLNCSHAGIESLEGLAVFTGLTHLRLSSNRLRNLVELGGLGALRELYLDDNDIVDPVPLYALPSLAVLDLDGNSALQCPRPGSFAGLERVILPDHCRDAGTAPPAADAIAE